MTFRTILAAVLLLLGGAQSEAGRIFTLPGGALVDGNTQFQIGDQKYPPGWLLLATDAQIAAAGITFQTVADPSPTAPLSGVLMLGDSITAYADNAPNSWASIIGFTPVYNGGVSSDTTTGMLSRLPTLLSTYRPKTVFLLGGVNDLSLSIPQATTVSNIQQIVAKAAATGATVFVQAILPVSAAYAGSPNVTNSAIAARNTAIHDAVVTTNSAQWLNWGSTLTSGDYADGIHLVTSGFTKWGTALSPYVNLYR